MSMETLDTVLDRSVLLGYTKIGHHIRRRSWEQLQPLSLQGRTVLVTGASSGIGEAAARELAQLGASVVLLARDPARGGQALARIARRCPDGDLQLAICDISDLRDVRRLSERLLARMRRLDVLVHNASVLSDRPRRSKQGLEITFATNVVGPFLLTRLLEPLLRAAAPSRIVTVSSAGMYTERLSISALQGPPIRYRGARTYAQSKRAQVALSEMWAQRLAGVGVIAHAMHPGWVDTPGLRSSLPRFRDLMGPLLRSEIEGADTIIWLACAEEPANSTGRFWHDRRARPTHLLPWTRETHDERARFWAQCERLAESS